MKRILTLITIVLIIATASPSLHANPGWNGGWNGGGGCSHSGGGGQHYHGGGVQHYQGGARCYPGWNGGYYRPAACSYGGGYGHGGGYGGGCGSAGGWYGTGIPSGLRWVLCGLGLGGLLGVATAPMIVAPQLVYAAPAPGIYPAAYGTPVY